MKNFTSLLIASMVMQGALAADRLSCDFTFGIPEDWVLIDNDGNNPSNSAVKFGFEVGTPWVWTNDDGNYVAASTSWYTPSGTSDDWMILSPVEISAETTLSWRAKAVDSKYRDGYQVYVSTTGATLDDFAALEPIFNVDEEEASWTSHSLSLADYAGKEAWVAFVNNSTNKSRLFVDDIEILAPKELVVELTTDVVATVGDPIVIKGTISSDTGLTGPVTLQAIISPYDQNSEAQSITVELGDEPVDFSFPEPVVMEYPNDTYVSIYAGSEDLADVTLRARTHYHVAEEFTGTWCGYCVRGLVMMEHMAETYPDDYIGIAVHVGDVMSLDNYSSSSICSIDGYPSAVVDRKYSCDPRDIEDNYLAIVENENATTAALDVEASYDNDTRMVEANTKAWFNFTDAVNEYRLAYVIVEDDVYHPDDPQYLQHNSYAGGESGEMGGFEDLPEYVEGIHFNEVARYISDNTRGISGSLPKIEAYKEYSHSYSFQLPDKVDDPANCRLIVLLLGNSGKSFLNAVPIDLKALGAETGVAAIASDAAVVSTRYYDLQGRPVLNPRGLVIELSTHADGTVTSRKVMFGK